MKQVSNTRAPHLASRRAVLLAAVVACALASGGCSSVKNLFTSKKAKALKPTELVEFAPSVSVTRLWSAEAGKGEGLLGARQGPTVADGRVYAAAVRGGVRAFDLNTGALVWRYESDLPLSGGPGAGDGLVVAGSLEGDVVALDAATGAEKWKAKVGNEVIAAPAIGQGMVYVHSNDGRLTALDEATGQRRWFWTHETPPLTVRGNSAPVLGPGYVFVANDDGTVTALAVADGHPLWEQTVAEQEGRTELERMADVDGTPVLDETTLYASSYKNRTAALDAPSGRPVWSHDNGGAGRVGVSADRVVVSGTSGTVWGLDKAGGSGLWQQDGLVRREVSGVAIQGEYAVVGDLDGYLHWLKLSDGAFAARTRMGKDPVRAAPVVVDGVLVAEDTDGRVSAYRLGQ
ncbi:MAG: outer membrane protein assembly factor BamB [Luteimonas sp.]